MNPAPQQTAARRASVLVVVLVVCLGLVSVVLVLGHSMLMAYRGADNEIAGRQAQAATLGAVQYAESVLVTNNTTQPGAMPAPTTYQSEAVPVGEGAFWFIGEPADGSTDDQPTYGLVDEASKLNLNTASVNMIELLPGMTADLAQAIVDWRTSPNTAASPSPSASSTGTTVTSGGIKQAPFESVEELGLVLGGNDPTLLYGDDVNLNHVLDPEETGTAGTGQGQYAAGLLEYCTVHSREPNVLSDGTKRIDVTNRNNVSKLLDAVLGAGRGGSVVRTVQQTLAGMPYVRQIIQPQPTGRPPVNNTWVNSVLEFAMTSKLSPADFAKVGPYLTIGSADFKEGLVNVNTASATVLTCLPGMTDATAQALVAARAQQDTTVPDNWSWVYAALGPQASHYAGPSLTTRSYQVSADVAAVGRFGRGYRRTHFIIDLSTGTPLVVYQRDLSMLGWALGRDTRASILTQLQQTQGVPTQGGVKP